MRNLLFILLNASIMLSSCSKEDLSNEIENSAKEEENGLKSGQVLIKAYPGESKIISVRATADRISIDWGDGTIDKLSPNGISRSYSHEYANKNLQKIVITGINLTWVTLMGNIYELMFGSCPELKILLCSGQLTALDVSQCTGLTYLDCPNNQLTSLDISKCTKLTQLDCCFNQLTALDVSKCTELGALYCSNNKLTSLDVSQCPKLMSLRCFGNQLISLNISQCTALRYLDCKKNQLSTSALNDLFSSLPMQPDGRYGYINYINNPGFNTCNPDIHIGKGWGGA
jgi:Leucine-rich repeat (LRR) protein